MIELTLEPYFRSWLVWAALAVVIGILFFLLRESQTLSFPRRVVLVLIRLGIIGLIFLTILRPGLTFTKDTTPESVIAVMIDQSASMQLPSGFLSLSRWDVAQNVCDKLAAKSDSFGEGTRLKLFPFDSKIHSSIDSSTTDSNVSLTSGFQTAIDMLPTKPFASVTDIAGPLQQTVDQNVEPPLQAVVWISDGIQTAETSSITSSRQIVRRMAEANIPLYLVGLGPRSGSEASLDQWVDGLPEQLDSFSKSVVNMRGLLRTVGLTNRPLTLTTTLKNSDGLELLNTKQTVTPDKIEQTIPFVVPITAPDEGSYEIEVTAEAVDGEATLQNNKQVCFLNVRESGSRVLYIEGEPRAEQKFIRLAIGDSADLQIDFWPIFRNTEKDWPIQINGLVQDNTYDCIILGDIDASALSDTTLKAIAERVANGAGLITLGGYHAYGPGGYSDTPLAFLLPVSISGFRRQNFGSPNPVSHLPGPIRLNIKQRHPIFELDDSSNISDQELISRWSKAPPLAGANRFGEVLPQLGTQVLAQSQNGEPLIIASNYQAGRVLVVAVDSTYLWWRGGFADLHKRFWRQCVLWAMKSKTREPGLDIKMDLRRLRVGMDAKYQIQWTGRVADEPMPSSLTVRLEREGEVSRPLVPRAGRIAEANGTINAMSAPGRYKIVAKVQASDGNRYEATLPFDVVDDAIELIRGNPDWQLMNQLAELNGTAGGRLVGYDQIDALIELLRERAMNSKVSTVQSHYLGEGPIDSWIIFLCAAILMSIQWILRKRWSLA